MKRPGNLALILLPFLALACSAAPDRPPKIRAGVDVCDQCRMIVNELHYAAAYRNADGQERRFDDIGCMITFMLQKNEAPERIWVHDLVSNRWLDATAAFYVRSPDLTTPMGFGVVAFSDPERAQVFAEQHRSKVWSYQDLRGHALELRTRPGGME